MLELALGGGDFFAESEALLLGLTERYFNFGYLVEEILVFGFEVGDDLFELVDL